MILSENALATPNFLPEQRVRIANLSGENADLSAKFVEAQVVLIWPYSSSTRRFALLLSEADARPLKSRRQLKVTFHDGSARAAQDSHVGIGDTIRILLKGCTWTKTQDEISTPGKKLDRDAEFGRETTFEVQPQDGSPRLVQYHTTGTPSPVRSPISNAVLGIIEEINTSASKVPAPSSTPAPNRTSPYPYFDSPLDPFAEDKEYVYGRSRKRTKFARSSGAWKLVDSDEELRPETETPSKPRIPPLQPSEKYRSESEKATPDAGAGEVVDLTTPVTQSFSDVSQVRQKPVQPLSIQQEPALTTTAFSKSTTMAPPPSPVKARATQRSPDVEDDGSSRDGSQATTTPRLVPLASPGLPLVSPLVQRFGVEIGYFPNMPLQPSELDAISKPPTDTELETAITESESTAQDSSDESVQIIEPPDKRALSDDDLGTAPSSARGDGKYEMSGAILPEVVESRPAQERVASQTSAEEPLSQASTTAVLPEAQVIEIEDEDMYGAPDVAPVRTALDVLEEFLEMSPAVGRPPQSFDDLQMGPMKSTAPVDGAPDVKQPSSLSSSHIVPDVDIMSVPAKKKDVSPPKSLDGSVDEERPHELEQTRPLQNVTKGDPFTAPATHETSQDNMAIDDVDTVVSAKEGEQQRPGQHPLTPAQTQETSQIQGGGVAPILEIPERPHLPTPLQSQDDGDKLTAVPDFQDQRTEEQDETLTSPVAEADATKPRRVSQRLTRKSTATETLSSPYFTPRAHEQEGAEKPTQSTKVPTSALLQPDQQNLRPALSAAQQQSEFAEIHEDLIPDGSKPTHVGEHTDIAYFPRLAALQEHFGQLVDVIAVCAEDSTKIVKSTKGPKDYHTSFWLADPSLDTNLRSKISVQAFRTHRDALPVAQRGDVMLLRNFKIQMVKHRCTLLSTDTSAWAVFKSDSSSRARFDDVHVAGPPIEYGRGEARIVKKLSLWWSSSGQFMFEVGIPKPIQNGSQIDGTVEDGETYSHAQASTAKSEKGKPTISIPSQDTEPVVDSVEQPTSPRRSRRNKNRTDNANNEDDKVSVADDGEAAKTPPPTVRKQPARRARTKTPQINGATSPVSPVHRRTRSTKSPSIVHELRDGTKYVDDEKVGSVVHELRDGRSYTDK